MQRKKVDSRRPDSFNSNNNNNFFRTLIAIKLINLIKFSVSRRGCVSDVLSCIPSLCPSYVY